MTEFVKYQIEIFPRQRNKNKGSNESNVIFLYEMAPSYKRH